MAYLKVLKCFQLSGCGIVGCVRNGQEEEYRKLIQDFVIWCNSNYLRLNVTKTKEMVVDFRRSRPHMEPVIINGECVEQVKTYKYLGVQLDEKLDWTANTDTCAGRHRVDCTSLEGWHHSMSVVRC